jgi:NADH:ubiquinone oxidoreductase subunit E
MAPYARHVFVCSGPFCDPEGKANRIYALLARKLGDLGQYDNPRRIKRGITPCLGVCHSGPVLVVYPEGIWYCQVDEALLDNCRGASAQWQTSGGSGLPSPARKCLLE